MSKSFTIITTVERELLELYSLRDHEVEIPVLSAVDSPNFHWLELKMVDETTRIEALRKQSEPDTKYRWKRPESFLVLHEREGKRTEQQIQRGYRGAGLAQIEIQGTKLLQFHPLAVIEQKDFLSLSFKVGRLTKVIVQKQGQPNGDKRMGERREIIPVTTAQGKTLVLAGPLSQALLDQLATQIGEVRDNRAIFAFLQEVWGNVETIAQIRFRALASFGEEAMSACQAFDEQRNLLLPDLDLPFWREHLEETTSSLRRDLALCESDEARLEELNAFLFHGVYFKEYGLPDPKSEHSAFQSIIHLHSLPVTYPTLYERV